MMILAVIIDDGGEKTLSKYLSSDKENSELLMHILGSYANDTINLQRLRHGTSPDDDGRPLVLSLKEFENRVRLRPSSLSPSLNIH